MMVRRSTVDNIRGYIIIYSKLLKLAKIQNGHDNLHTNRPNNNIGLYKPPDVTAGTRSFRTAAALLGLSYYTLKMHWTYIEINTYL